MSASTTSSGNFFEGTTEAGWRAQLDRDRVWDRPHQAVQEIRRGTGLGPAGHRRRPPRCWAATRHATRGAPNGAGRKLPPTERKAIEILEVTDPRGTKTEIRQSYKALIKVLHPDMNGGDRSDEDRLQEVVWPGTS